MASSTLGAWPPAQLAVPLAPWALPTATTPSALAIVEESPSLAILSPEASMSCRTAMSWERSADDRCRVGLVVPNLGHDDRRGILDHVGVRRDFAACAQHGPCVFPLTGLCRGQCRRPRESDQRPWRWRLRRRVPPRPTTRFPGWRWVSLGRQAAAAWWLASPLSWTMGPCHVADDQPNTDSDKQGDHDGHSRQPVSSRPRPIVRRVARHSKWARERSTHALEKRQRPPCRQRGST